MRQFKLFLDYPDGKHWIIKHLFQGTFSYDLRSFFFIQKGLLSIEHNVLKKDIMLMFLIALLNDLYM
jgi:hypothetical protein